MFVIVCKTAVKISKVKFYEWCSAVELNIQGTIIIATLLFIICKQIIEKTILYANLQNLQQGFAKRNGYKQLLLKRKVPPTIRTTQL